MHERILRLNIAGSPVDWLNWEEAVTLQARGMVAWTLGSPCMIVRGGRSRLTGEQSQLTLHSIMACEGRVYDLARRTPNLTNTSLFRRDQHLCLYCGKSHGERDLTRDHVVPISRGATIHGGTSFRPADVVINSKETNCSMKPTWNYWHSHTRQIMQNIWP